jgi:hypothetical protein
MAAVAALLLIAPASALDESTWVLWVRFVYWVDNDIELRDEGHWEPRSRFRTLPDCETKIRGKCDQSRPSDPTSRSLAWVAFLTRSTLRAEVVATRPGCGECRAAGGQ